MLEVLILSVIQGITEFIPVSSSAHLILISEYFNFINLSKTKFFYHENSNYLLFPNSERHVEVVADKFPINEKKFRLLSKYLTPFTGGSGRYREYIYKGL